MNRLDQQYQRLLQDIIEFGVEKKDRTGTGTKSLFGYTIRHNMRNGFPLLTTKKMAWKTIVTELLWFLRGDTNIKYLVDNNCHIWDGDAFKNYLKGGDIKWLKQTEVDTPVGKMNIPIPYTQEEFINKIKTDDKFAKTWGELGPIYGKQWRNWGAGFGNKNTDQIANLINELKTHPDSRRLMVSAWNVGELDQMVLPPCHYSFQVYTRELSDDERARLMDKIYGIKKPEDRLMPWLRKDIDDANIPTRAISLMWNQRSVDTFLGLPFNIASYGLLLTILAKEVNMVPDELIGNLGDTHLYLNHIEQAKQQMDREPFELPKLKINTEFWQTESGECGIGPLKTNLMGFEIDDFTLENYQSHPTIKAPLSN
jgi:thymidylate synthase